jgi:hypothetical protein
MVDLGAADQRVQSVNDPFAKIGHLALTEPVVAGQVELVS